MEKQTLIYRTGYAGVYCAVPKALFTEFSQTVIFDQTEC